MTHSIVTVFNQMFNFLSSTNIINITTMTSKIIKHFISQTLHQNLCRICFNDDENTLESIYQFIEDNSDLTLIQIIEDISQIKINLKNGLPLVICSQCKEKAIFSYMFREDCRKTDTLFQDTMNQLYRQVIDIEEENLEDGQSIIVVVNELEQFPEVVKMENNAESNDFFEKDEVNYNKPKVTKGEIENLQSFFSTDKIENSDIKQEGSEEYIEIMSDLKNIDEQYFHMQCEQNTMEENFTNVRAEKTNLIVQEKCENNSNKLIDDLNQKLQRCTVCDEKFISSERLKRHIQNHERSKAKPICDICGKSFCNTYHLAKHKNRVHTSKDRFEYTCQYCGKSYKGQISFDSHIARHEGVNETKKNKTPNAICDYCGISYSVKYHLEKHILGKHFDIRPHECQECGKCFRSLGTLRGHRIVHTRVRDYICSTCNKGFVDRRAFYIHSRLHTGERPFSCDNCGRSFVSSNRRNTHMLTAHTAPTKKCPQCPSTFHLQSMVNTHFKKVHMRAHSRRKRIEPQTNNIKKEDITYAYMESEDIIEGQTMDIYRNNIV